MRYIGLNILLSLKTHILSFPIKENHALFRLLLNSCTDLTLTTPPGSLFRPLTTGMANDLPLKLSQLFSSCLLSLLFLHIRNRVPWCPVTRAIRRKLGRNVFCYPFTCAFPESTCRVVSASADIPCTSAVQASV